MRLMLDTSVLIAIEHGSRNMLERIEAYKPREVCMSAICLIELEVGVAKGAQRTKTRGSVDWLVNKFAVVPFDALAARKAAKDIARHDLKGDRAGTFDALIAAHAAALALALPVAYCDGDFNRFVGRKLFWG